MLNQEECKIGQKWAWPKSRDLLI